MRPVLCLWVALTCCWASTACDGEEPVPTQRLESDEARARGRALFVEHCALCHGENADGQGVRRNLVGHAADFTSHTWRQGTSPRQVFETIRDGEAGTSMPAWRSLDEDAMWDLTAYVLSVAPNPP